ncbi:MAG: hypothetical protein RL228_376 [Actinomycetota bacterium]|jgi:hypothetical protein
MSGNSVGVVGENRNVPLEKLLLDFDNPRFNLGPDIKTQVDVANSLIMSYDVFTLAESIAGNGFFANEPLVAVASDKEGFFTVVEGNRRLSALKGLCVPEFRKDLFNSGKWDELAASSKVSEMTEVPVIIVKERAKASSMMGYRHISGITGWDPLAQARFVAKLVDQDHLNFEDVAKTVGKTKADVTTMYRNQGIALQAESLGFSSSTIESKFTYLTVAMSHSLRNYVGAPIGNGIQVGKAPISDEHLPELDELLTWLYGKGEEPPVVQESREIGKLAKVAANPTGLVILRDTGNLREAEDAMKTAGLNPYDRLMNRLKATLNAASGALDDISDYSSDPTVKDKVAEILEAASALDEAVREDD